MKLKKGKIYLYEGFIVTSQDILDTAMPVVYKGMTEDGLAEIRGKHGKEWEVKPETLSDFK